MRKLLLMFGLVAWLAMPVSALEMKAPEVPESGRALMPADTETFAEGLLEVIQDGIAYFYPDLKEATGICLAVVGAVMAVAVIQSLPGNSQRALELAGTVSIAVILLGAANSLISLGTQTVAEISDYGKLLLPVMTAAMAAQGGLTTASALYAGTAFFDNILSSLIGKILTPLIYLFLTLAAANSAIGDETLKKLRDAVKWVMTWSLKIILYVFTGYMGITGVVSGTTDAATLKATKLTISGMVPMVGNILSDASEAVLVSAGTIKNAAGVYGLLAVLSIWLGPFLRIGAHYLLLKLTSGICGIFGNKRMVDLIGDFSTAMGFAVAMTGTVCLMLMISTVCFMKGFA